MVWTPFPRKQYRKLHDKYALELGRLVAVWNSLHDSLAYLFWQTTGITNEAIPTAIWHSTPSDLNQRKMLRAAAQARYADNKPALEAILWLLNTVDSSLSGRRNNAIHAPMVFLISTDGLSLQSLSDSGNPRADALVGKEVVKEIIWYRKMAAVLDEYTYDLRDALVPGKNLPLPPRPLLPTLNQRPPAKEKRRAAPRKGRRRQPSA